MIKPTFCCLEITDKCMLKCRMCYKWRTKTQENNPTIEQYKKFISDLRELTDKNFIISFVGGEVLLFDGVLDLIKFSSEKEFLTNIASNGWLIEEEMAERIGESGLNEIDLSLDSLNESTHDYLRGVKGVYRRVMSAIKYLNKYCKNTKIIICCVIYDWNLNELNPLLEWVINNDEVDSISFLAPKQPSCTGVDKEWWKGEYSYLWPRDSDKVCLFIDRVIERKTSYPNKISNSIQQLEKFKHYFSSPGSFIKNNKCNFDRIVHVNASGDIFLCFLKDTLGNIKNGDDIREIWRSQKAIAVREKIAGCNNTCHFLLNYFFKEDYPFGLD